VATAVACGHGCGNGHWMESCPSRRVWLSKQTGFMSHLSILPNVISAHASQLGASLEDLGFQPYSRRVIPPALAGKRFAVERGLLGGP